ncbi:putative choline transport protein [Exidia glandulosa HHB12029]|uniref:Putative choline transport protein n=1 Tax=Exidia glandulosa HHB12029 TaxID=1314781 RepID=A0A165IVT1_EXIGL|nr:putative choline transport protein [Exidia glandulosa HHB12029]
MADIEKGKRQSSSPAASADVIPVPTSTGHRINASGHVDQLPRQYGLLSICATALVIDNAWVVMGGSVVVSIANGGAPGLLYELLTACVYYGMIGLCLAELASAIPAAGGVYHWASVTPGPRYGRVVGFFAGHIGYWGWLFGWSSLIFIPANMIIQMWAMYHPDFVQEPWHLYVIFLLLTWFCVACVIWCNRFMPFLQTLGLWIVVVGGPVTIIVLAAMPEKHASHAFVWKDFQNVTGWSNGAAFLVGVLNGAYAIGTPDSVTHMAEELPHPRRDLPKAIFAQLLLGSITSFCYAVALMYAITDLDAVVQSPGAFPLAVIYAQATGSRGGTFGLLFIVLVSITLCGIGGAITVGRNLWALAREDAVPFSGVLAQCNERLGCPVAATVANGIIGSAFGAISLGSKVAFNDLAGSFIILTTCSFLLFILPNALNRGRYVPPGPFSLGPRLGPVIHAVTSALIVFFTIVFCLPYALPVTSELMNYNCVIIPGLMLLTALWWFASARTRYRGPRAPWDDDSLDVVGKEEEI